MTRTTAGKAGPNAAALATLLFIGLFATACAAIHLTRQAGGVSTIWPVNAFMMAGFMLAPKSWRVAFGAVCAAGVVAANILVNHDPLVMALLFTSINVAESIIATWLFQTVCHGRLNTPTRLVRFVVQCVLPSSALGAVVAAGMMADIFGGDFLLVLRQWFAATGLGSAVMFPSLLILCGVQFRERLSGRSMIELALGLTLATLFLVAHAFSIRAVGLIITIPALTLFAFQRGAKAAVIGALSLAAIALPLVILRAPPNTLTGRLALDERVWMVQIFIAAVFFTALITALAVQAQQRLARMLQARTQAARAARVEAEAASRAKTEFLATMSHEIRTPMNSIIGFTDVILRRGGLPEDTRHQLQMVERASGALLTVVNDILDFSKVEAGQVLLNCRPFSILSVCQDSLAIVDDSAKRKGLALDLVFDTVDAMYMIDDHRLRQILLNLLNNAIKFTDAGQVTLKVSETISGRWRFEVIDTGMGISPEAAARLFQRFSQADSSISRTHGGTGLGLAICKGLVELMGGRIGVDSRIEQGSTFWFELPLVVAQASLEETAVEDADAVTAHILLVDDHPMNRELATTVLGLLGCTTDVAADGHEAIARANERAYDVIFMDVHMPGLDGLAATRAIRASEGLSARVPIIAMSADVMPEQVARCREAGMVDSVGKPIRIEALHEVLTRWVGRTADEAGLAHEAA